MKKIVSLFIIFSLCIGLVACGHADSSQTAVSAYNPSGYVGLWENFDSQYGDTPPQSIELFSNGKAILDPARDNYSVDQALFTYSGEWFVENDRLIVCFYDDGISCAYNFKRVSTTEIELSTGSLSLVYTKQ